jgi:hypothetical protein
VSPLVTTNYLKMRKTSKAQELHSFPELLILNWKQGNITLWPNYNNMQVLKTIIIRIILGFILSGLKPFLLFFYIIQYNLTHNTERSKSLEPKEIGEHIMAINLVSSHLLFTFTYVTQIWVDGINKTDYKTIFYKH